METNTKALNWLKNKGNKIKMITAMLLSVVALLLMPYGTLAEETLDPQGIGTEDDPWLVGAYSFYGCEQLRELKLGKDVKTLNYGAFMIIKKLNPGE